jgi:hypothetical protein
MSDISTMEWNEDLIAPWRIFLFLMAAGLVGREMRLSFYVSWVIEAVFWVLWPIFGLTLSLCVVNILGGLYWLCRWVLIMNGSSGFVWWLINVPCFCFVDVYTLEWIIENGCNYVRLVTEGYRDHKEHITRQHHRWMNNRAPN